MKVAGVELDVDVVRAVTIGAVRGRTHETLAVPWDPSRPDEVVERLRLALGPVVRLGLSVGTGFLEVSHVRLPPAPAAARLRMVQLEPDRHFPVAEGPLAVALDDASDVAFAADAATLEGWVAAFGRWAPVETIVPAPLAALRAARLSDGVYRLPAGPGEHGRVEVHGGRLHAARRAPDDGAEAAEGLPAASGVDGAFLGALGAARGVGGGAQGMLLSGTLASDLRRRRLRRLATAALFFVISLGVAVWSVDRSRALTLDRLRQERADLAPAAALGLALLNELEALQREADALLTAGGGIADPLGVLEALSETLPGGVTVQSLQGGPGGWQIEGTAPDAAAVVPLLDADPRFRDVRFLSASARFREDDRTYETFAIAFDVRPDR